MSQTNHICVSLDFYGIDRHLESLLLPLVLVRGTPLNTKHRRGEGAGGAGERGRERKRAGTADFSEDCTFLLTHLSRRVVFEEIRKDEG